MYLAVTGEDMVILAFGDGDVAVAAGDDLLGDAHRGVPTELLAEFSQRVA